MGLYRWHLAMPWFESYPLAGSVRQAGELCWRGDVMWESADGQLAALPADGCRAIETSDAGRRIFGISIKPGTLAMQLTAPLPVRLWQYAGTAVAVAAVTGADRGAGASQVAAGHRAAAIARSGVAGDCDRRCELRRRRAAFRRRRRRLVLRRRRPRHPAEFLAGDVCGALEGGEKVFTTAAPVCAISAPSSTPSSARAISAICRWCCCCRF